MDRRTISLPVLKNQRSTRRQRRANGVEYRLSGFCGNVVQNVAEHHEVVLPRFAQRDFLYRALHEPDSSKRSSIKAADSGGNIDSRNFSIWVDGIQPLRDGAFSATNFQDSFR